MFLSRRKYILTLYLFIACLVASGSARAQTEPAQGPQISSHQVNVPLAPNVPVFRSTLYLPVVSNLALPPGNQGLQGGWAIDDSGDVTFAHALSTETGYMQQAGAGWVRINFRLGACFSNWTSIGCNGMTALQDYDQVVSNAVSQHLNVMGLLSNESWPGSQTDWTGNNAENAGGNGDNSYLQSFASNAAAVLASHFNGTNGALVSQWEVWNEPNAWTSNPSSGVYTGGSFIYPSNFAWLLKLAYPLIKSANPTAVVISGGLFVSDPTTTNTAQLHLTARSPAMTISGGINASDGSALVKQGTYLRRSTSICSSALSSGADYLCNTYSEGSTSAGWLAGAYPLDAIGQHLYLDQFTTTSTANLTTYLQDLHNAYLVWEGAGTLKQIQVTEVGWSTANVSATVQAQNLQLAYTTLPTTSFVGRAYWFDVQDLPEAGLAYGLVDTNGVPKSAFTSYQQDAAYQP